MNCPLRLLALATMMCYVLTRKEYIYENAQKEDPPRMDFDASISSPNINVTIMETQQYHFVPLNSYFQYTLTSWEFNFPSNFLSQR